MCIFIQLALDQHLFELHESMYAFFFNKYTVGPPNSLISHSETYPFAAGNCHAQFIEFVGSKYVRTEGRLYSLDEVIYDILYKN